MLNLVVRKCANRTDPLDLVRPAARGLRRRRGAARRGADRRALGHRARRSVELPVGPSAVPGRSGHTAHHLFRRDGGEAGTHLRYLQGGSRRAADLFAVTRGEAWLAAIHHPYAAADASNQVLFGKVESDGTFEDPLERLPRSRRGATTRVTMTGREGEVVLVVATQDPTMGGPGAFGLHIHRYDAAGHSEIPAAGHRCATGRDRRGDRQG